MSLEESDCSENESGADEEMEEPGPPVGCLFCSTTSDSIEDSIEHIKVGHDFNIEGFLSKNVSSTYDLIKIVTYIRSKKVPPSDLDGPGRPWDSEEYLKPVDPEDPWLWTDFDFIDDEDTEPKYVNSENGVITLSKGHFDELQKRNTELKLLVEEKDKQMEKLRNLLNEADEPRDDDDDDASSRPGDDNYFSSYSSFEIHREMLGDVSRMDAFKSLFEEKELFVGRAVLDVGCGTGILAMMAAAAGAQQVVGVDDSDILYSAMEIIHENGYDSTIKLIKNKIENVQLEEKFDIIVSEWMGYFLLFEGMLSSVLTARDRFLKPGGLVFPSVCRIWLAGVSDPEAREARLMTQVCGFKMSALRRAALEEISVEIVEKESISSEPSLLHTINVIDATQESCFFSSEFTLVPKSDSQLTALCGWFDCKFDPASTSPTLDTSPWSRPTHWKQSVFYLSSPLSLTQGERVRGRISVSPTAEGARSLVVNITLGETHQQTYNLA